MRTRYQIGTANHAGVKETHIVEVSTNSDGSRYVVGREFGCSRDYRVADDKTAVKMLLAEHAQKLNSIKKA